MRNTILLAAAMLTLISCGGTHVRRQLDDVATYIEAAPDSALAVLESIDRTSLRGNGVRAEFSLLYAMALDKNYIDTSDVNVAMPAVKYYDVHGSDEKAMKAWFYLGREQENAGSYEEAVVSYTRAKELSQDSDNLHFRALIASGISDLYGRTYNHEERLLNLDEVYHFYDMACDTLNRWISIGELAVTYSNLKQWDKADSLFNDFFSHECLDSSFVSQCLIYYFYMKIQQPNPEPEVAVSSFLKATEEYDMEPTVEDYCAYAYALELCGNTLASNDILEQVGNIDYGSSSLWKYYIYDERKIYDKALREFEKGCHYQDSIVVQLLRGSLASTQRDYFEAKSALQEKEAENQKKSKTVFILVSLLVITMLVVIILSVRRKRLQVEERMASIQHEAMLQSKAQEIALRHSNEELGYKDRMIENLRQSYMQIYKSHFKRIEDLGAEYWQSERTSDKNRIYRKVKEIVAEIEMSSSNDSEFEKRINYGLDDVMTKLRLDFPHFTEDDFRFLAYTIVGFEAKTISTLMDISPGSVYTRKSRLKEKILSRHTENAGLYRICLS